MASAVTSGLAPAYQPLIEGERWKINDSVSVEKITRLNLLAQNLLQLTTDKTPEFQRRRSELILRVNLVNNLPITSARALVNDLKRLGQDIISFREEVTFAIDSFNPKVKSLAGGAIGSENFANLNRQLIDTLGKIKTLFAEEIIYKNVYYFNYELYKSMNKPDVCKEAYDLELTLPPSLVQF